MLTHTTAYLGVGGMREAEEDIAELLSFILNELSSCGAILVLLEHHTSRQTDRHNNVLQIDRHNILQTVIQQRQTTDINAINKQVSNKITDS